MPVEIKELVIRASTTLDGENNGKSQQIQSAPADNEAIVQECVKQVLRILKKKKER